MLLRIGRRHFTTNIRASFDQPWLRTKNNTLQQRPPGLLGYPELSHPEELIRLSEQTLRRAGLIVSRIVHSFTPHHNTNPKLPQQAFLDSITAFDRLSDVLCRVIDLAESIRNLHPHQEWVFAANQAHQLLSRYMNTLNTHKELYDALDFTLARVSKDDDPKLVAAKTVAQQFIRDFQRHGIDLSGRERKKLVEISDEMMAVGRMFFAGACSSGGAEEEGSSSSTWTTAEEVRQIGSMIGPEPLAFDGQEGRALIEPNGWPAHALLRYHPSATVRRRIWLSQRQSPDTQVILLESLLKLRYQFARLTGKQNWAEVVLEDKMLGSPANVRRFLDGLAQETRPLVQEESRRLRQVMPPGSKDPIHPWDRDYYSQLLVASRQSARNPAAKMRFSVGNCLETLSSLFSQIYGISFEVEAPQGPEEVWDELVVKLAVIDEAEGRIGTIYCDLFDRPDKSSGAAHYTVRCSRRTDLDQAHLDFQFLDDPHRPVIDQLFPDPLRSEPLQVPVSPIPGKIGTYQRPVVVFSCTFEPPNLIDRQPSLLAWSEVETLFHEMGHAIHSMIGQTEFHNVSGTRCPTDFVELPSILMEHFARSKPVLRQLIRNQADPHKNDQIRDVEGMVTGFADFQAGSEAGMMRATETYSQLQLAVLDQLFHSEIVASPAFDSTFEYQRVVREYEPASSSAFSEDAGSDRWHARFGHLYGYGASYYSYLFDRVIAQKIWATLFDPNPTPPLAPGSPHNDQLSRANGERLKHSLLKFGGARDPWISLAEILNIDQLADGGFKAVDVVRKWGLWK
ncbi:uncharacterized protein PGTG_11819 [Puccinia graminis f. sp. tritici CRL 75-36-700-3]|uniref:mitochondrial intermediate peptidase n=1 Tax=Puccinia graminis f. sp. tritici (strain CRL 75-36-700-3 / race SCCL) TaxID=418459 RepID=E3KMD8_PUCGT|nr:uncharacterized protein PGTG_11819 [Puccinia graminis f. sp. tritici CRL 75-36-700-3]EFP85463.1 hypothetical protein PGTG_11819 [Puccinia graminis f. sp. tritici CRL 75-36-700-3]